MSYSVKPLALKAGAEISVLLPASPAEPARLERGCEELRRLGYSPDWRPFPGRAEGYFAGSAAERRAQLFQALESATCQAIFCGRGGYGSTYLLDELNTRLPARPKIVLGYSDFTCLQVFLWQKLRWVTFYGPMVAAGFDAGAGVAGGYDAESFTRALTETRSGRSFDLCGEAMIPGEAEGVLLGGCLTLVETTLGTPWELDTTGAILLLEDRGMRPYAVDRALMHLKQAGKLTGARGMILGEFPECEPPPSGGPTVRQVCQHILRELGVPVVWGAPVGHTLRAILTLPLGVRACLRSNASPQLDLLEPAVAP